MLGDEFVIDLLYVWVDTLSLPVHAFHQIGQLLVCHGLYSTVAIRGFLGNLGCTDRVEAGLVDGEIHHNEPEGNLNLLSEIGELSTDKSAQVLLQKHLEDLNCTWVSRNQLDHGSLELWVTDFPSSIVHNLKAVNAT